MYDISSNAKATIEYLEIKCGKRPSDKKTAIDAEALRRKLNVWVANDQAQSNDVYKNIKSLMSKIDERSSESDKLQLMIDFFVKVGFAIYDGK